MSSAESLGSALRSRNLPMNTSPDAMAVPAGIQRVDNPLRYQTLRRLRRLLLSPPGETPTPVTRSRVGCGTREGGCAGEEAGAGDTLLIAEDLGVGQPGVVIDGGVDVVIARPAG